MLYLQGEKVCIFADLWKFAQKPWVRQSSIHKLQLRKSQKDCVRKSQIRLAEGPQF
jgi:hypothetical protein